jgi:hypothetical protein
VAGIDWLLYFIHFENNLNFRCKVQDGFHGHSQVGWGPETAGDSGMYVKNYLPVHTVPKMQEMGISGAQGVLSVQGGKWNNLLYL